MNNTISVDIIDNKSKSNLNASFQDIYCDPSSCTTTSLPPNVDNLNKCLKQCNELGANAGNFINGEVSCNGVENSFNVEDLSQCTCYNNAQFLVNDFQCPNCDSNSNFKIETGGSCVNHNNNTQSCDDGCRTGITLN